MPSFDIVSRADIQEIDNACTNTRKEIEQQRFDFRGAKWTVELDKKEKTITLTAEEGGKLEALKETLTKHAIRRKVNTKFLDFGEADIAGGGINKRVIKIKDGLEQDIAKDIVKRIKAMSLKVQGSIQGEEVRVTSKNRDDLQIVIQNLNASDLPVALQYVNMKSD